MAAGDAPSAVRAPGKCSRARARRSISPSGEPVSSVRETQRDRAAQAGTSLVELLLGTTIVITLLMAISQTMVSQSRVRRTSEERSLAMTACRNNLESLRQLTMTEVVALHDTGFDVPGTNGQPGALRPVPGDSDGLPGRFSVTVDQVSAGERLYLVRLTVDWIGVSGRQSFQLHNLVTARKTS